MMATIYWTYYDNLWRVPVISTDLEGLYIASSPGLKEYRARMLKEREELDQYDELDQQDETEEANVR